MHAPEKIYRAFPAIDPAAIFRRVREENPILDAKGFYLYASGRAALYHGALCLRQLGIRTIYAPEYHCGVEIEALVRAGLSVRFYPLDERLSCDLSWLQSAITEKNSSLLIIHYFGFPQPLAGILELCREKKLFLIEDCAHALYSSWNNRLLGTIGDMAIFSLQKTIPLPNGGGLLVNNSAIPKPQPGKPCTDKVLWKILVRSILDFQTFKGGLGGRIANYFINLYNGLSGRMSDKQVGVSGVSEQQNNASPCYYNVAQYDYEKTLFPFSGKLLKPEPFQIIVNQRRANYLHLLRSIEFSPSFSPLFPDLPAGCCPLCFPVQVDDNDFWAARLREKGIHPFVFGRFSHALLKRFGQQSDRLQREIICLPVHQQLTRQDGNAICRVMNESH